MKRIVYISVVDVSKKNGQGVYALESIKSIARNHHDTDHDLAFVLPKPANLSVLQNDPLLHSHHFVFLRTKEKERQLVWHIWIQLSILFKLVFTLRPDFIVYSLKPTMIGPWLYSKMFRAPVFLQVEGMAARRIRTLVRGWGVAIGNFVLVSTIRDAAEVYPAYSSAKEWVDSLRQSRLSRILRCGVDSAVFVQKPSRATRRLTIGYVGSFRKEHLLAELIAASRGLNLEIYLVGDGVERDRIQAYLDDHKQNNVHLLGPREQHQLPEFFAGCDVMWACIDIDHWAVPIKCAEYLACNKKVIVSERADFEFVTEREYGYVLRNTTSGDIRTLLLTIQDAYNAAGIKDNLDSAAFVKANNDWSAFGRVILSDIISFAR